MRLIDADRLTRPEMLRMCYHLPNGDTAMPIGDIEHAPTVDAVPVVQGKWIMTGGMKPPESHHLHQCSVCAMYAPRRPPYGSREMLTPWCPYCMAKMDLEEQQS